ncbi:MAG: alpha/beta fold hydrolase [Actinomycetes bacterium]
MSPSTTLVPGATQRDVAVCGVRFSLLRADPPRKRRTTPVLLLHGVPETAAMWRDLVPDLARDRIVLAPDLKGLGGSEARGPYDVPTLVQELAALVLHEVDQRVDVVGHDWGATLALGLAAERPELVRRLVVCNGAYRHVDLRRAWHIPLFAMPMLPEVGFTLGGERAIRMMLSGGWRSDRPLDPDVARHYVAAYRHPDRVDAMLGYYRSAVRPRVSRGVRQLLGNVPGNLVPGGLLPGRGADGSSAPSRRPAPEQTLVVWGVQDPVLPVSLGEAVVADVDGPARLLPVPQAGHFVVEEAPEVVVPAVAEFLREGERSRPSKRAASTTP